MATDYAIVYYYQDGRTRRVKCDSYGKAIKLATERIVNSKRKIHSAQILGIEVLAYLALPKEEKTND